MITIDEEKIAEIVLAMRHALLTARNLKGMRVVFTDDEPTLHHAALLALQSLALPGTMVKSSSMQ